MAGGGARRLRAFGRRVAGAAAMALLLAGCGGSERSRDPEVPLHQAVAALQAVAPAGPWRVGARTGGQDYWVYYPAVAAPASSSPAAPPPLPQDYVEGLRRRFGGPSADALAAAPGHSEPGAIPAQGRFPLLVFAPGASMGGRDYRLLVEDLASRGYVVAVTAPLGSPPASESRYAEAADETVRTAAAVLRDGAGSFSAHVDPSRIGFFGHSIGGAAAVLALSKAPWARAAVNLDGDYLGAALAHAPLRPILHVEGVSDEEGESTRDRRSADWTLVAGGNPRARLLVFAGLRHFDFADASLLAPFAMSPTRLRKRFGPAAGRKAHDGVTLLVAAFFDEQLRGRAGALDGALAALRRERSLGAPS